MLNDEFPEFEAGHSVIRAPTSGGTTSVTMHVCGEDVDAVVEHARSAGADVIVEPHDAFWKARYALVKDPFGHCWSFSNRCKGEPAQPPAGMSNPSAAGEAEKEKEKE